MIGRTLGHYRIVEPLGAGGMGEVYRAHDERLDRDVALKVLPEGALSDEEARKRFRKEAHALSRLSHPHIATIHDFDSQDGTDFIVMELVSGPSLADELKAGPLEEKRILTLGAQLARGLQAAHQQGIVHRDLKPSNLQLTPDGLLKILDFGLARLAPKEQMAGERTVPTQTAVGKVAGTLAYMSPEQLRGRGVDARTDLYAAGAVLYEMTTGRRLFAKPSAAELTDAILHEDPTSPRSLNSRISPGLESVILKALDKDPELRSQTAKDLLVDLERLSTSSSSGAAGMAVTGPGAASQRWSRWTLGAAVVAALAVAGVALLQPPRVPRVKNFTAIAQGLGTAGRIHGLATDGHRVYFVDNPGHVLRQVAATGGDPQEIPLPFGNADPLDYSARLSALLLRDGAGGLWALTIPGNKPRRLGDLNVGGTGSAAWSPEGDRLAFIQGTGLYLATAEGLEPRRLVDVETHLQGLAWSPDGRRIRTSAAQGAERWIVEIDTEDPTRPPKRIVPGGGNTGWPPGTWTRDGRYFVFAPFTSVGGLHSRLLVRPEGRLWPWASREPVELLPAPDLWVYPTASPLDDRVFIVNSRARVALRRFDRSEDRWVSDYSHLGSAEHLDFTADGEWVVWVTYPEGALWRARVDGTERLELSRAESTRVLKPRWSPDGRRIAFERSESGGAHKPFVIPAEGGSPEPLPSREGERVQDTCWLSDESVVFGYLDPAHGIQRVDLDTGAITAVPGSEGLTSPRCGPGGVILAAEYSGSGSTHIFDPEAGGWGELPIGPGDLGWAEFASDGRGVFGLGGGLAAINVLDLETHELSVVTGIDAGLPSGHFGQWFGLAPDDSPLYLADVSGWDLYALELEMP